MKSFENRVRNAARENKPFKRAMLLAIWRATMPTPALGFVLGAVAVLAVGMVMGPMMDTRPLLGSVITGVIVALLALLWQAAFDRYWRDRV